jgi:hypothetical protein
MMTAQVLWMNIPLMVLAFGAWVGVPLWLVLRHPDRHPRENRAVPAYLQTDQREIRPARAARIKAHAYDGQRGLVAM